MRCGSARAAGWAELLGPSVTVAAEPAAAGRQPVLDRLGRGVEAVAWADDKAVAAVELAGHPFAIGLQWHPEDGRSGTRAGSTSFRERGHQRPRETPGR